MVTLPRILPVLKQAWDTIKTTLSRPDQRAGFPVLLRHAGVVVDHDTALTYSAYFRGVSYIAQTVAGLPWDVIRDLGDKTQPLPQHRARYLLHTRPNREMSAFAWRETLMAWALTWGNGYAEIEWDGAGRPVALWPISPDRVQVKRDQETGQIYYEVSNYMAGSTRLAPEDVFHLHGLGFDGLVGYSIVTMAARSLGIALAGETYAEDFFANNGVTTGGFTTPKKMSAGAIERLRNQWAERATPGKKFTALVLEEDTKWFSMALPSKDAQVLESRMFQVTDIARWLGLPPHKLADLSRATFSNIQHQSIEVVNDALMPWVVRLEQEANYKLFSRRDRGLRTKLNVRGLLRGDDMSRATYYQVMRNIGVYSTNDIRKLEDMDPVGPEGDELLVQINQTTLKRLAEGDPNLKGPTEPEELPDERAVASWRLLVEDAFRRVIRRETNQYEQRRHKLTNRQEVAEYLQSYRAQQRDYMRAILRPLLICMTTQVACGIAPLSIEAALDAAVEAHVAETEAIVNGVEPGAMPDFAEELRTRHEARALMERVFAAISQEPR